MTNPRLNKTVETVRGVPVDLSGLTGLLGYQIR